MKTIALVFALVCSMSTFADTVNYRLFEDSIDQFTPFVLSIEVDGAFKKGSKIKSVVIKEVLRSGTTVLFSFDEKEVKDVLKFKWNADNTLVMASGDSAFSSVVKSEVSNGFGDTSINAEDTYSFYFDGDIILNQAGSVNDVRFEISNMTQEESCLWGMLKK